MSTNDQLTATEWHRYLLDKFSNLTGSDDQLTRLDAIDKVRSAQSSLAKLQRDLYFLQSCYQSADGIPAVN